MAHAGVGSRRYCEGLIAAGRVTVNGQVVSTLGSRVDPAQDRIEVDGRRLRAPSSHTYLLLHKPAGYVTTAADPHGRPTVLDLVPADRRIYPVGRLDMDSEGLLLLTDDGALTQRLTHPSFEHEKEYHALVQGRPTGRTLQRLREGIELEDGFTSPAQVSVISEESGRTWLGFTIHEGRKRQLRRMCESVGHPVDRLVRVRMGPLRLGDLATGSWRRLRPPEVRRLKSAVGLQNSRAEAPLAEAPAPNGEGRVHPPLTIAIDGPAAAGKSTVGEMLAQELGYLYFDTGIMYRAVTLAALLRGIPIADEEQISQLAERVHIDVLPPTVDDGRQYTVLVDSSDVTWDLRREDVEQNVSPVSAYPRVRQALTAQQRRIGRQGKVVMVGRDIGTMVLPEAPLKLYLDASAEERARRRYEENVARGLQCDYEVILRDMRRRDAIDSSREAAPLKAAPDAVVINTTDLSVAEVLDRIRNLMKEQRS